MTRAMDTAQLRGLRDRLSSLQTSTFQERVAKLCGAAALKLVADEFRFSRAPDGTPWAPVGRVTGKKLRRGQYGPRRGGKPLLKTRRLMTSFGVQPTPAGFRIGTAVPYAGYHQRGTSRMVARPMLPGRVLPESWQVAMATALNAAVRQQLAGKAAA